MKNNMKVDKKKEIKDFFVEQLKHCSLEEAEERTKEFEKFIDEIEQEYSEKLFRSVVKLLEEHDLLTDEIKKKLEKEGIK